ncbi:hypothetical protein EZV62_021720 [Acer yangbiense]|uniref:SWIM-type domain-containing protein n=1 Tax=Acer yangbiense TaxID=1000413 RepID=A0A5C7H6H1_9ROSI|nr:hypothetical protein EZV62_021720 [Acer yangbiense]
MEDVDLGDGVEVEDEGGAKDEGVQTGEGVKNEQGVGIDGDDEITKQCMALYNGYESRSDDDYFSDSDQEDNAWVGNVVRGVPFERQLGGEIKFFVGQSFGSKEEMRDVFREYAVREGVTLGRIKNDLVRQTYVCKSDGCPWRAHGSQTIDKKSFILKTLVDKHSCHRVYNNSEAKIKWIASRVESLVKSNPTVSAKLLGDLLLERYNVAVDIKKLYNVKHRLMSQLRSEHNNCFRYLRQYAYTLNQTNPGTTIHIKIQKPLPTFHRLFLSFEAQKQGFLEGCRPFIGLDGCHLKGPCGGVLLSAVALDANSGIFPLAVCICEKETMYSWMWFLNKLKMFLQFPEDRHLCFMSDRQKGLINALETHFPLASTRFCARHIYANFRSSYPGDNYKKMFWMASRSSNLFHFNAALDSIGEVDIRAKEWLKKIDPHYWSRFAYDQYIRCDHVTNNMTEAFNKMLGTHRAQTYLQLLEFIRRMVMTKLLQRKEECDAWKDVLPPRVNARIIKNSKASRQLTIITAGAHEYELLGPDGTFAVKLREYHCGCGSWQISGIPCPHAMAAISHSCGSQSMKDWKMWPPIEKAELLPPPYETQPGRPKMQRKRKLEIKKKEAGQGLSYASYVIRQATTKGLVKVTSLQENKSKNEEQIQPQHHSNLSHLGRKTRSNNQQ